MIGQQLDLFGAPLRPPKKILVDEPVEEETPTQDAESTSTEEDGISAESPVETGDISIDNTIAEMSEDAPVADVPTESSTMVVMPEFSSPLDEEPATAVDHPLQEAVNNDTEQAASSFDNMDEYADDEPEEAVEIAGESVIDEDDNSKAEEEHIPEPLESDSVSTVTQEKDTKPEPAEQQQVVYRGRKTGDPEEEMEMLNVPPDEELFKRQYYSMREAAAMFNVNQALLRFWENEFDILQPKKNKKGDRYFRPVDIKNLVLIYHLLRVRKFTMEGAKDYLQNNKKAADSFQLVQRLEKLKSFLLELKANL